MSVDPTQPLPTEPGRTAPMGSGDRILIILLIGALAVTGVVVALNVLGSDDVARESPVGSPAGSRDVASVAPSSASAPSTPPTPSEPPVSPVFITPDPRVSFEPVPTPDPVADPWGYWAWHLRGQNGTLAGFTCPPGGPPADAALGIYPYAVWGANPYTDDSSVCRAGVHAGVITVDAGGRVTVRILPGMTAYPASEANGIQTLGYGVWEGSFEAVIP